MPYLEPDEPADRGDCTKCQGECETCLKCDENAYECACYFKDLVPCFHCEGLGEEPLHTEPDMTMETDR